MQSFHSDRKERYQRYWRKNVQRIKWHTHRVWFWHEIFIQLFVENSNRFRPFLIDIHIVWRIYFELHSLASQIQSNFQNLFQFRFFFKLMGLRGREREMEREKEKKKEKERGIEWERETPWKSDLFEFSRKVSLEMSDLLKCLSIYRDTV